MIVQSALVSGRLPKIARALGGSTWTGGQAQTALGLGRLPRIARTALVWTFLVSGSLTKTAEVLEVSGGLDQIALGFGRPPTVVPTALVSKQPARIAWVQIAPGFGRPPRVVPTALVLKPRIVPSALVKRIQ